MDTSDDDEFFECDDDEEYNASGDVGSKKPLPKEAPIDKKQSESPIESSEAIATKVTSPKSKKNRKTLKSQNNDNKVSNQSNNNNESVPIRSNDISGSENITKSQKNEDLLQLESQNLKSVSCKEEEKLIAQEKEESPTCSLQKVQEESIENLNLVEKKHATEIITVNEDLWGEEDGWNIDDTEENIDQNAKTANTEKSTEENDDKNEENADKIEEIEDLWGNEDDWDLEDTQMPSTQSTKEENLWTANETRWKTEKKNPEETIAEKMENLSTAEDTWSSWGNWGINTVLNTAVNISSSVSQGLTNVLETGIGVPDPEELARLHKQQENEQPNERNVKEMAKSDEIEGIENNSFAFVNNWVPGVSKITKLVETTGTKVIAGGLDTLEVIGKKTMEVLQENDPGLKKKRAFLRIESDKPVLSQILREAKEKAEIENKEREKKHVMKKANYETIFDDYQGLVHLEALEMLSKQCEIKLQSLLSSSGDAQEIQETVDQVRELCELDKDEEEDQDLNVEEIREKISTAIDDINIPISYAKLFQAWDSVNEWISDDQSALSAHEIHLNAIENLAQITAMAVEQYHKAGELLLVKERRSTADEADSLVQLTTSLSNLITILSNKYTEKLKCSTNNDSTNPKEVNELLTNIFLEAANSCRYIEDAFQLLVSVIQIGAV